MDMPLSMNKVRMNWEHQICIYFYLWEAYIEMEGILDLRVMSLVKIQNYANNSIWRIQRDGKLQSPTDIRVVVEFVMAKYHY